MGSGKKQSVRDDKAERRHHQRTEISSIIGLVIDGKRIQGKAKDLSKGGILVVLSDGIELKRDQRVVVTVSQEGTERPKAPLELKAKVAWSATSELKAGLSFSEDQEEEVLEMLRGPDEAARQEAVREELETLHKLEKQFAPKPGISAVCKPVAATIYSKRKLIGHSQCHIWYYDPTVDKLVWEAGRGHGVAQPGNFRIRNSKLEEILIEKNTPVLEPSDVDGIDMPSEIWSAASNWIFPLNCRSDFYGLLYFAFDEEIKKPFEPTKQFWFCYGFAAFLVQFIERDEFSHDNLVRSNLLKDLPELTNQRQMEDVYEKIIEEMCQIVGCDSGVFRLYDPDQNLLTVCAKRGVNGIEQDALCYTAGGDGPGSCPKPEPDAPNPEFCGGCETCRKLMPEDKRALRTTLWDPQKPGECIGQVCCFVGKDLILPGRLSRRLLAVSKSLTAVMETALHQVIRKKVQNILSNQRKLAAEELDARPLLTGLVKRINDLMSAKACSLFLADENERRLSLEATTCKNLADDAYDTFYSLKGTRGEYRKHLTSLVGHEKRALAVPNTHKWHEDEGVDATVKETPGESGYSFIGVPVFAEANKLGGVIRCSNKIGYPGGDEEKAAFHRHDMETLTAIAESCAPLILAATGERKMTERLVMAGHEVTATAALIQQKGDIVLSNVRNLNRTLGRVPNLTAGCLDSLQKIEYGTKGIRGAGAMITLFQEDVSLSLSSDAASWDPESTNLYGDVLSQVVDMIRSKSKSKGIKIDYDKLDTAPPGLPLDPLRMQQLFYNLLINAVKYNRRRNVTVYRLPNGETVTIPRNKILVRSRWTNNRKLFSVVILSDGREIHEDEREHVWDYGFQGRAVRELNAGLGIGMHVCKKIADAAEGLELELTQLYEPVVFTVRFTRPILRS